jgi:hypothetical protein
MPYRRVVCNGASIDSSCGIHDVSVLIHHWSVAWQVGGACYAGAYLRMYYMRGGYKCEGNAPRLCHSLPRPGAGCEQDVGAIELCLPLTAATAPTQSHKGRQLPTSNFQLPACIAAVLACRKPVVRSPCAYSPCLPVVLAHSFASDRTHKRCYCNRC